ncbi:MAG: helix-turn-helix domain-containing protein [Nevskia sp.]|nr:helix-turn-helix domain-containing protein [Nevskia sp.]
MTVPEFRLFLWPHRLLVLAAGFHSAPHRHHAAQIVLGLESGLEYQGESAQWQSAPGFVIPPDVRHAHRGTGATAMLYVEAEGAEWRSSELRTLAGGGLRAWTPALSVLGAAREAQRSGTAAEVAAFCARALGGPAAPELKPADPRILDVQAFIAAHLDRPLPSAELAGEVGLSASRLAHLFRGATGIPVRRYILWRRLRAAVQSALQTGNLTEAAHAAGFADSAHLSRTFRAMFGITPSLLASQTVSVALLP